MVTPAAANAGVTLDVPISGARKAKKMNEEIHEITRHSVNGGSVSYSVNNEVFIEQWCVEDGSLSASSHIPTSILNELEAELTNCIEIQSIDDGSLFDEQD